VTDTQLRFLRAIAAQVPVDRVAEVHLFPALRQGGVETGVAVVAVEPLPAPLVSASVPAAETATELVETLPDAGADATGDAEPEMPPLVAAPTALSAPIVRHVVYSARYRHTLKGPERGKWESDVHAEADAPLITVEVVVRGVRERAGEAMDPDRLSGDAFRAAVSGGDAWTIGR
jgi:hypothetical protein